MDAGRFLRSVRRDARARVFCFGFAGGGTAEFRSWSECLLPAIDLCPVILPGRETRLSERAFDDLPALVEALLPALGPVAALAPWAVYGHSMGAWVGFEWVRALRRLGRPLPMHLFVGARRAPHRPPRHPPLSALPDAAFLGGVQERYGGIPEAIRGNPELMALFLPTLRADFTLLDRYRYRDETPLPVPVTAIAGRADVVEELSDLRAWSEQTSAGFALRSVEGGHFFVREAREEICDWINAALRSAVS